MIYSLFRPTSMYKLMQFITHLNQTCSTIKSASEMSYSEIPFLDPLICIKIGKLHTKLYKMPADNHMY